MKQIAVVGGGIGGLCTAIRLASLGYRVEVFEKNKELGGKLWRYTEQGFSFSYGPSTLTMPWLFTELADLAGIAATEVLPYRKLPLLHRNVFADGTTLDAQMDPVAMAEAIRSLGEADAASDADNWANYLSAVKMTYDLSVTHFFTRSFTNTREFLSLPLLRAVLMTRPLLSMQAFHGRFFQNTKLLMTLNRYATYVGSAPDRVPATLAMIGHIEYGTGVYYLPGGTVTLIDALMRMARATGVKIHTGASVERIQIHNKVATGLQVAGERLAFDSVCLAVDTGYAARHLFAPQDLPRAWLRRHRQGTLSHSGFALLLGLNRRYDTLAHHTVFYPEQYAVEFEHLFQTPGLLPNPAIYVCNTSVTDPTQAPEGGSNLFVLVNTPSTSALTAPAVWEAYEDKILEILETRCGLTGLRAATSVKQRITPEDLRARTNTHAGALYGLASHTLSSAFLRPPLRLPGIRHLYFTGGSSHPGGGTPMVAISAKLVSALIAHDLNRERRP